MFFGGKQSQCRVGLVAAQKKKNCVICALVFPGGIPEHSIDFALKDTVMRTTRIMLLTVLMSTTVLSSTLKDGKVDTLDEDIATASLLQAIRQSSMPARNMRVKWTYETVKPLVMYIKKPGRKIPDEPPHRIFEYSATMSGIRSRIESFEKTFENRESQQPYDIRRSTAVFNGTEQRRLVDRVKGERTTPLGWQYLRDKNLPKLTKELFGWPFDLNNEKLMERYVFKLLASPASGIYVLEIVEDSGTMYHFTVDGNKGFNITRIECFRAPDDRDYETNFELKQYKDGIWYIAQRQRIRYPRPGREGEPRLEYKMRVTQAEFNIEVPEETFKLEFPHGTKVWDSMVKSWYNVGVAELMSEDELLAEPGEKQDRVPEGAGQSPENVQPGGQESDTTQEGQQKGQKTPPSPLAETGGRYGSLVWFLLAGGAFIAILAGLYAIKSKKGLKQ